MDNITNIPTEGSLREQMAAYFLSLPPPAEQTPAQRQAYLRQLKRLGELERQEILSAPNGHRPLVWGNPAALLQTFLAAAQRLAAGLGQPLLLFPARDAAIGGDTLFHPRVLTVTTAAVLADACAAAPRRPVWVQLQERRHALAVTVTAEAPFVREETLALIKECTGLHGGSPVHCDNTVLFTCALGGTPPQGARLYGCPTEADLLQDTLSPVWSGFYAAVYSSSIPSSKSAAAEEEAISSRCTSSESKGEPPPNKETSSP